MGRKYFVAIAAILILGVGYGSNPVYTNPMTESEIKAELTAHGWLYANIDTLCGLISNNGSMDWNNWDMRDAAQLYARLYDVNSNYQYALKTAKLLKEFANHMSSWQLYQMYTTTGQTGPFELSSNAAGLWGKNPDGWAGDHCIFYDCTESCGGPLAEAFYYIGVFHNGVPGTSGAMESLSARSLIETSVLQRHLDIQYARRPSTNGLTMHNYAGDQMCGMMDFKLTLNNATNTAMMVHDIVWNIRGMYKVKFWADGWWSEGTTGYHHMAHENLLRTIDDYLQGYSDPVGYTDAGDGTRFDNLNLRSELSRQIARADWVKISAIQPRPESANYEETITNGDSWFNQVEWYAPKMTEATSINYGCANFTILGMGLKNGGYDPLIQASLLYEGKHGHEQNDSLHLTIFAKSKEIMSETEYKPTETSDPNLTREWCQSTASHNTVVVNSQQQPMRLESSAYKRTQQTADAVPGIIDWEDRWRGHGDNLQNGKLKLLATENSNVKVVEVDAQRAYGTRIDGALMSQYRRMIALVKIDSDDYYVVDIFRVKGGTTHDYMLHSCLEMPYTLRVVNNADQDLSFSKYATDPVHTYINSTYYASGQNDWASVFSLTDGSNVSLKNFVLGINDAYTTNIIKGVAPAIRRWGGTPFLMLRRTGLSSSVGDTFVAVHHPYKYSPLVTSIQKVTLNTTDTNAVGLRVLLSGGRTDTIINTISDSYAQIQTSDGGITLQGHFAHVAQNGSTAEKWAYMAESKYLNVSGKILMGEGSYQGTITDTYRQEAGDSFDAFVTDTMLPTDGSLDGRYLIVDEGGLLTQTFRIAYVDRVGSETIIYSYDEPGITISSGLVKQEYYPCWGISGTATFKICDNLYANLAGVRNVNTGIKYSMIQPAIDAASSGNTIEISDGVYYENIDLLGKNLILKSLDPNDSNKVENTIISGVASTPTVTCDGGENSSCIIAGFTIVNGTGSGILCSSSSPTIKNCSIADNDGNGISLINSGSKINGCLIAGNTKDGIEKQGSSGVEIIGCTIAENILYGIHYPAGSVSGDKVIDSIVWNNNEGLVQISSSPLVQYSDIGGEGFSGLGNIIADPCFVVPGEWLRCWYKTIDLGTTNVENGVRLITTVGDGDTEAVTILRHNCRKTLDKASDYYMYFDINDKVVYQGNQKDWYIQIDYYDSNGGPIGGNGGSIGLEYDSDDGNDVPSRYKSGGTITINNTNTWTSRTFHVTDAYFGNRQNGGADFRMAKYSGGWMYLDWVYVRNYNTQPFDNAWVSGNYHLKSTAGSWEAANVRWVNDSVTSLCIDAGNPGYSLGAEPVGPNNVRINMGNYGGNSKASKTPANWRPLSDMTNDGIVNFKDVGAFCDYWLNTGSDLAGDFNRNSAVNFIDFAKIADQWYLEASWY